jgi:hypothetical protein
MMSSLNQSADICLIRSAKAFIKTQNLAGAVLYGLKGAMPCR